MSDDPNEPTNFEAAKVANHIGKSIAALIAVANHRDVWCIIFDEVKKQGWVIKDEPSKKD